MTLALYSLSYFGAGCGSECDGRSLRILEPADGATVPSGRVNVVVEACGLEMDEQIRLRLTTPVASDYGFALIEDPEQALYTFDVPTLPGTMELFADVVDDGSVISAPVAFSVSE